MIFLRLSPHKERRTFVNWMVVGSLAGGGLLGMSNLGQAQTFSRVGPRYPGEVIISERVVTPRAESLPAPTPASPAGPRSPSRSISTLSVAGDEPMSLSDGGLKSEPSLADQAPLFALGHEVWKRMLELERENAELQANLDYERKLANYFEHSQDVQQDLNAEIAKLRQQVESLQKENSEAISRAMSRVGDLSKQNTQYESEIQQLRGELAKMANRRRLEMTAPEVSNSKRTSSSRAEAKTAENRDRNQPARKKSTPRYKPMPTELPAPTDSGRPSKSFSTKKDFSAKNPLKKPAPEKEGPEFTLTVIPIGFEIADGLIKPTIPSTTQLPSLDGDSESNPSDEQGLQGGPRGPLGSTEP